MLFLLHFMTVMETSYIRRYKIFVRVTFFFGITVAKKYHHLPCYNQ